MLAILTVRKPLGYRVMLLLLIILSACSRNMDIPGPTLVTQIQFKENLITVAVGKSAELKVLHSPSELNPPDYDWSVSDANVVRVENGIVYGLKAGETEVSVSAQYLGLSARIKIRVVPAAPVPVESVSLNLQQINVPVAEGARLVSRILPANATDQQVVWSSADPQIADVDEGIVLGIKEGTTTISVTTADGQKTAACQVRVTPIQVHRIILSTTRLALLKEQKYTLATTVLPNEAKDKSLKWNSSNVSVATVDQQGEVMAKGKGTAFIWAVSVSNPRAQAACQVMVE
ncbi:uncharacterized protein YjdB [Pedobacter africanus]|uniref:Uncharacterized protein YjdB n=1 Tax=Pedobacter africanus TaxID=151894 RepID=A0ACC6L438_9SPHI|nr:Ig-like domain-containing protein [Pedobacter africanus]MDR6786266.1 uncharacterized protein YjdB [Pedobacter africanus]